MASQIDLHMHSAASDGTDSPDQLVKKVRAGDIRVFALTDHDTVVGAEQLAALLPEDITFIPGIEFSCRMAVGKCHILGYGCDSKEQAFREALDLGERLRRAKLDKRLAFLREERGIQFPEAEIDQLYRMPSAGKPHLANLMVEYGYAVSKEAAIEDTINLCATGDSRIPAEAAVKAILKADGIPVWAHPLGGEGDRPVTQERFKEMLKALMSFGLMGLECYYSKYPLGCCTQLAETAKETHLLISGGSDYHGTNKPIGMGTLNAEGAMVASERITVLPALMERGGIAL